ncbi:TetR/AcrR family transcriptional regulator [Nonomuraea lactucae]|uniref:TetR/AcrR family transcriptional regulator n=1 Tax=Nonomuraea lactucae TaxID=2249762 RepID=UPI000DE558CA|nr:TetR/AcrR family transcriptional regulator [Nonomuraea lactucae]
MIRAEDPHHEAVIAVAMRLIAAFGYDGTSLQQIAEASGHDVAWMQERFGDKRGLYLAVIKHAYEVERAAMEDARGAVAAAGPREVARHMHGLVDRYLDFCMANPQIPSLWMHRWLGDAADIPDLEETYAIPLLNRTRDVLRSAARAGLMDDRVDMDLMVQTLVWSTYGFLHGEALGHADHSPSGDSRTRQRFRAHLHQLVDRMLKLPGIPSA